MNRMNRFGRNDHKDEAASASAAHSLDAGAEPPEGFADYEDYQQYEGYAEDDQAKAPAAPAAPAPRAVLAKEPTPAAAVPPVRTAMGAPAAAPAERLGWRWGLAAAGTAAVVGLGVGGSLLLVFAGHPGDLWRTEGLTGIAQWLDLKNHPQNLLYLVILGSAVLAGLVGFKISQAIDGAGASFQVTRSLLAKVAALRLEKEEAWQDPAFDAHSPLANFTSETLGAWRHQEARLRRMVGIEGELHRLEKALSANSRDDIAGHYETPVVGILSDSILKIFDEAAAARSETQDLKSALQERGQPLIESVQDARGWQRLTQDQLNLQQAALEKTAAHLGALADRIRKSGAGAQDRAAVAALVQEIKRIGARQVGGQQSAATAAGAGEGTGAGVPPQFNDLLDRFTKLAFQIAMEVARLGARGERLLPMAQSLEDLTAGFRQVADQLGTGGGTPAQGGPSSAQLQAKLDALSALVDRLPAGGGQDLAVLADKVTPAAGQVAANLIKIAQSFDQQQERLTLLGQACSELTGRTFDPASERPQAADMELTPLDPFLETAPQVTLEVMDPFLKRGDGSLPKTGSLESMLVTSSITPGSEGQFEARRGEPQTAQPDLPDPVAKVYDLREFGAVRMDSRTRDRQTPDSGDGGGQIHDLAEFGAVRLGGPDPAAAGQQRIYDLTEFGARRVG